MINKVQILNFKYKYKNFCVFAFLFLIFAFLFLILVSGANAAGASLYLSPSIGSYTIGNTFSISVKVNTGEQAINAGEATLVFDPDILEVITVSKAGSIFSLWTKEPSFSNSAGTVSWSGGAPNPGFTGASGTIITITFKGKLAENASVSFSTGAVLANDGKGTNILTSMGGANYTIKSRVSIPKAPSVPESTTPSYLSAAPPAPKISSLTHPDPNDWYPEKNTKFHWELPSGVTGVRLLVGKLPQVTPTVNYFPAIDSKELTDFDDGVWYFHVQLRNEYGWGGVSHFRFRIDTVPPDPFDITFIDSTETDNPRPTVIFETVDQLSGIDYYKIKIGEGEFFDVKEEEVVEGNPFTLPLQKPGKRNILVQAFDRAGNYSAATEEFVIKPIEAPKITSYPQKLQSGEALVVEGSSYADSRVTLWLQEENKEAKGQSVQSDSQGNFVITYQEKLKEGVYKFWIEAIDKRGAMSEPTEEIVFRVTLGPILKFGKWAIDYLTMFITLIILIGALMLTILYSWYRITLLRKKIKKGATEAKKGLHEAFDILREEVKDQIAKIDRKGGLNFREKRICNKLKKALKKSEKAISEEIKEIEKKLK